MRYGATATIAGLALLAAGCGGTGSRHPGGTGSQSSGPLAFARCMRSNGVARFPDPAGSGAIPKLSLRQLGVESSRFEAAEAACRHLLPGGNRVPDQARQEHVKAQSLRFSECVRAHGVPGFPDPDSSGRIPDPASVGIDQGSPAFQAANSACGAYRPPYLPSNSAYDSWARAQTTGSGA